MNRRLLVGAFLAAVFITQGAWAVLHSQTAKPPGALKTERVKGDLHVISGEGGNVAAVS